MSFTVRIILLFLIFIFFNPATIALVITLLLKCIRSKKVDSIELDMLVGEHYDVVMDSDRGEVTFNHFDAMWGYVTTEERYYYNRAYLDKYVEYMDETKTVRNLTFNKFATLSDIRYKFTTRSASAFPSLTSVLIFEECEIPYKRISQITRLSDNTTIVV